MNLPETNLVPKDGWLEDDPFLLGFGPFSGATVDFSELLHQLRLVVYISHHVFNVSYIPAGCLGFLNHQGG